MTDLRDCGVAHRHLQPGRSTKLTSHRMPPKMLGSKTRAAVACTGIVVAISGCKMEEITFGELCSGPPETVTSVRVQPSQANLRVGFTLQIEATALDTKGQWIFCSPPMQLSSTAPSVATVSAAGLVIGVAAGRTFIRAVSGGKSDSVAVTVVATTIATVSIQAPTLLLAGQTAQLKLVARDTDGNV